MLHGRSFSGRIAALMIFFCSSGAFADGACEALQGPSSAIDGNVNLVFVPSGYAGDMAKFRQDADRALSAMGRYPAMGQGFRSRGVYLVTREAADNAFCNLNCNGIQRLLCCDVRTARTLSGTCGAATRQTLVIHNDSQYGGGGYSSADVAGITTNNSSPEVLVHELGHSLFNLGDEYNYGNSTSRYPNCDSSENCDKWADLIADGVRNVGCSTGYCGGGAYRASGNTVMSQLRLPFNPVNERIACCEYKNITGEYPSFCDRLRTAGLGLDNFCRDHLASEQIYVARPLMVELERDGSKSDTGQWRIVSSKSLPRGRYFRQDLVLGDGTGRLSLEIERNGELKTLHMQDDQHVEYADEDGRPRVSPVRQPRDRFTVILEGGATTEAPRLRVNGRSVNQ